MSKAQFRLWAIRLGALTLLYMYPDSWALFALYAVYWLVVRVVRAIGGAVWLWAVANQVEDIHVVTDADIIKEGQS